MTSSLMASRHTGRAFVLALAALLLDPASAHPSSSADVDEGDSAFVPTHEHSFTSIEFPAGHRDCPCVDLAAVGITAKTGSGVPVTKACPLKRQDEDGKGECHELSYGSGTVMGVGAR